MEFMGEGRELVPDGALPLVEAPCWFCSPSVSMAAEETDEASVSQTQDETNTTFSLCESLVDRGGKKTSTPVTVPDKQQTSQSRDAVKHFLQRG